MTKNRTTKIYAYIAVMVLFFMLILMGLIFSISIPSGVMKPVDLDYETGWYGEDGQEVNVLDIDRSEGIHKLSRTVDSAVVRGGSLCCTTSNITFNVFLDDVKIYDFHPELPVVYGNYYGTYTHFISIPQFEGTKSLRIEYQSFLDSDWTAFQNMRLTEGDVYYQDLVQTYLGRFMQCFLIVFAGLLMVLCGFIFDKEKERFSGTIALGVISIVLACYSNSEGLLIQAVTDNSMTPRLIEFVSLMLLPIPAIIYVGSFTGMIRKWYVRLIILLASVNTFANFVIVLATDIDYRDVLFISHIIILIGLVIAFYMIGRYIKENGIQKGTGLLLISGTIIFTAGFIDMVRYYFTSNDDSSLFTRYGLMVFVVLMGYNEIRELIMISENSFKTELMAKVAYTDALTGIPNREAFYLYEKELQDKKEGSSYQIVQLDLNYLKRANDEHGHQEGDKLIIAAARVIDQSFGKFGKCFRTGGDEFIAAVESAKYDKTVEVMSQCIEEANNNEENKLAVPLSIAYGAAEYIAGKTDIDVIEAEADALMYQMKKEMKAERKD